MESKLKERPATPQDGPEALLAALQDLVADKLLGVQRVFREELGSDVEVIDRTGQALARVGGKRIRPLLTLLTFGALGYEGEADVRYAVVLEYVHNATLIHDDVIDEADLRRGRETLNARYGTNLTILIGDWIYTKAMNLSLRDRDPQVLQILTDLVLRMIEGEIMEIRGQGDLETTEATALEINRRKTAELFAGCCRVAAHVSGASPETFEALCRYGDRLGMAFQAVDDLLDYTSDASTLGKPVLHDLEEGRLTLPTIYMLEADPGAADLIRPVLEQGTFDGVDRGEVIARAEASGALDRVRDLAARFATEAEDCLDGLPGPADSPYRKALAALPGFVLSRSS